MLIRDTEQKIQIQTHAATASWVLKTTPKVDVGGKSASLTVVSGKLDIHMLKNEPSLSLTLSKNNSRWIEDLKLFVGKAGKYMDQI